MIDWFSVLSATLWIAGLAFLLALVGFARASRAHSTRQILAQPNFRIATNVGLALFALGMSLSVGNWFERGGWLIVFALVLWEGKRAFDQRGSRE
jgi:hypothetical protein